METALNQIKDLAATVSDEARHQLIGSLRSIANSLENVEDTLDRCSRLVTLARVPLCRHID